jgi:hypothetical protein
MSGVAVILLTNPLLAFGFTNLAMLGWLAAAAAPLLIHLWSRRRFREVSWAAVEFLRAAVRKNARRVRLQNWLLIALRTLLIILVVLALAEPYRQTIGQAQGVGTPVHRVIVIDGSFSMDFRGDEQSLFERAQKMAIELVEGTSVGDTFTLIVMGQPPELVYPRPSPDKTAVVREISALKLSHQGADLSATLRMIRKTLDGESGSESEVDQQVVYFFTDLGRASWQLPEITDGPATSSEDQGELPSSRQQVAKLATLARLMVVDVGQVDMPNCAIVRLGSRVLFATPKNGASVFGVVANYSSVAETAFPVQLLVEDVVVDEKTVDIAPRGEASVDFTHRFQTLGNHKVSLQIAGDRLTIDNRRSLILPVKEELQVLCVAGRPGAASYLVRALNPALSQPADDSLYHPVVISDGELVDVNFHQFDCVVLCNVAQLTKAESLRLVEYLRKGGGVIVFLGDQVLPDQYNQMLAEGNATGNLLPARLGNLASRPSYRLDPRDYQHPIVEVFKGQERAGLLTTPVACYYQLEISEDHKHVQTAVSLENGDPFVVTGPVGRGRSVLVATACDLDSVDPATGQPWTTMPAWPSFLPIVREMLLYAMGPADALGARRVGEPIGASAPDGTFGQEVRIERPDKQVDTVSLSDFPGGLVWTYDQTELSDVYTVTVHDHVQKFALNINPEESDLTRISQEELPPELRIQKDGQAENASTTHQPMQFAGFEHALLYMAILLALLDVGLAWLFRKGVA